MRKTIFTLALASAFALGCGFNTFIKSETSVHAYATTFDGCTVAGGATTRCSQYLVQLNQSRGFGKWIVYQITDAPIDATNLSELGAGNPSVSVSDSFTDVSGDHGVTISASQP